MANGTVITLPIVPQATPEEERARAEALARRYHAEFVDLKNFRIQHDLLRTVPVELMFRYNFVPIEPVSYTHLDVYKRQINIGRITVVFVFPAASSLRLFSLHTGKIPTCPNSTRTPAGP